MKIMFVGDISLGEYYTAFGHGPRSYMEHGSIFSDVSHVLDQADIVVGNLEAPLTTHNFKPDLVESVVLRGDPNQAYQLRDSGFKVLQLANNHSVQHGKEGFSETLSVLKGLGIAPIGLQCQPVEQVSLSGQSVGFLAASDVPDNTDKQQTSYQRLDSDFLNRVRDSIRTVDHLFVMLHWGLEASTRPLDYQVELIRNLAGLGVRGIIGSHPHLFYEIWRQGTNTIAAPSLGNFVFDLYWDERLLKSGILDVELSESGIKNVQVWPAKISDINGKPSIAGPALPLHQRLNLYNLGSDMRGGQIRKVKRFIQDYKKGTRDLKKQFILKKLRGII